MEPRIKRFSTYLGNFFMPKPKELQPSDPLNPTETLSANSHIPNIQKLIFDNQAEYFFDYELSLLRNHMFQFMSRAQKAKKRSKNKGTSSKQGRESKEREEIKQFRKRFGRSQTELQSSISTDDLGATSIKNKPILKDVSWRKIEDTKVEINPIIFEFNSEFAMK